MWLVLMALRRPVTVVVAVMAVVLSAALALRRAPVDVFPELGIPVIYVVQPYAGLSPTQMESQVVTYYEYHFLYISGIEHIESQAIQGMAMLKLYFHPGTNIAQSMAQVVAMTFRATAFMPPGTLPAFIVRYDAGSIPVGQLVFSSGTRSDTEIQDLALYRVRPLLATVPGVSAPPPAGGKVKTIVVYADPDRMRAYRLSPDDLAVQLGKQNLTLPAGNVRVNGFTAIAATNALVPKPQDLADIPLRVGSGPTVFLRDVARVEEGADIVYNIALVNGRRTVYMPVTKRADASTLNVVDGIKAALPQMRTLIPPDIRIDLEFDQSVYVLAAIRGLATEGALGALLTSLMVLLFLRNWRSALIVALTIPFSLLAAIVGLRLAGQTLNIMTLGGLALAVGILVDEATVAIENIHAHLARGQSPSEGVLEAMHEVMLPRFLAMLCVLAVFIPAFFMVGVGRALFPPLALAVSFAMVASFFLSSTLVPVLAAWLFRHVRPHPEASGGARVRWRDRVVGVAAAGSRHHGWVVLGYFAACAAVLLFVGSRLGTEIFPRVDTGQFQLRIRAPDGTQLERTEGIVRDVDRLIRETVGQDAVSITLANIGNPPWTYPVNAVFTWNGGPHEALLLVALKPGKRPRLEVIQERLRDRLTAAHPDVRFSFEAGDIVSQVLSFGAPTPVNIRVSGNNLTETRPFAERIASELRKVSALRDVQIPQSLDYPTFDVRIDRQRSAELGVDLAQVGKSLVSATSSSSLIQPNFWVNPATGIPYRVAIRVPEAEMTSTQDLQNLPVMPGGAPRPMLGDLATITPGKTFGELDHFNSQRTLNVLANVSGHDLGAANRAVEQVIARAGQPPRGARIALHGQIEQMANTLESLREGLLLAVVAVLLLLVANFQSIRDSLVVVSTIPAVLTGTALSLWATGSTLNVQSMMGAIMSIGVSVANALLLVTFTRSLRQAGKGSLEAVLGAVKARLRPVVMTSLSMIAGMVPLALGLGEGGEQNAPLGRAVMGGLSASMLATLLVVPAVYVLLASKRPQEVSLAPRNPGSHSQEQA